MPQTDFTRAEKKAIQKEMISKVDRELLEYLFIYTLEKSNYHNATNYKFRPESVDDYLALWANAKWRFYVLFNRELHLRKKTEMQLTDAFSRQLNDILSQHTMERRVNGEKQHIDISHFIYYHPIIHIFPMQDLMKNVCPDFDVAKKIFGDAYKPKQKLSRFFSKFFDDENFDIQYSKLFQNHFDNAFLNISIDPIDFLTIGTSNTFDNSCYSLTKFYQGAGYSFMLDKTSIVAFMSKKDAEENHELEVTYLNKINRAIIDVTKDFQQISFNGIIVHSFNEQHRTYLEWLQTLIKLNFGLDLDYCYVGQSYMQENYNYNHIVDNPGPCYTVNANNSITVKPGYYKLPSLSSPKTILPYDKYMKEGWMS